MNRYVVIGGGVAGISAAEAIRQRDQAGEIMLFGSEAQEFYSRPGLAYLLSGEIPESSLFPLDKPDYRQLNIRRWRAVVKSIDPLKHRVFLENGSIVNFDRLLVATGATAAFPSIPGIHLPGVVKMDTLDDVRHIFELGRSARTAVVVGGGITALELVEGLIARGVRVHYFLRGERYWNSVLSEAESGIVEKRLKHHGAHLHYKTELAEIMADKGRVNRVRTKDNHLVRCDMVGIAIGVRPRKEMAEASGLQAGRGIIVNETLQTNFPDIYAAGDVAQVFNPLTGQSTLDSLWGPAHEQGFTAGLNMSGAITPYQKKTALNVTRLAGLTTTILGMVGGGHDAVPDWVDRGESETWRRATGALSVEVDSDTTHLRMLISDKTLVGAVIMGDQKLSAPLQGLIVGQVDVSPIRSGLTRPDILENDLLTSFWNRWQETNAGQV
jgi:NAD(P)H-nitrite reductase large subunit